MKYSYILFFFLFITTPAVSLVFTAAEVGNGTIAITCYDPSGELTSIELLDSLEAKVFQKTWKLNSDFLNNEDPELAVANLLQKLKRVDSQRAELYLKTLATFGEKTIFVDGESQLLTDTNDAFTPLTFDDNCQKETLISQLEVPVFNKKYAINRKLFYHPLLRNGQRALALLHELIYSEFISQGFGGNSQSVRSYTVFLAQEVFAKSLRKEPSYGLRAHYLTKTQEVGLKQGMWIDTSIVVNDYGANNVVINKPLRFCPNDHIFQASTSKQSQEDAFVQWDCDQENIVTTELVEKDLPLCEFFYCSDDGSTISMRKTFGLYQNNIDRRKQEKLTCPSNFPVLKSVTCQNFVLNPLESEIFIDVSTQVNVGQCMGELKKGLWATLNFSIECEKL